MVEAGAAEKGAAPISIEVAWADADGVHVVPVSLAPGATVADALRVAAAQAGAVFAADQDVGVWGKLQPRSRVLVDGDRVELYAPLKVDPKKARRERFARQGARRAGLFATRRPDAKAGY